MQTMDQPCQQKRMELFCSKLKTDKNVSIEKVVKMITVGSKYKHSKARELVDLDAILESAMFSVVEDTEVNKKLLSAFKYTNIADLQIQQFIFP